MTSRPTTYRSAIEAGRHRLIGAGIDANEAALDAELLAREVLQWDRAKILAYGSDTAPDAFLGAFDRLLARRASHEPMSLILGRREFWGREFLVTPDVLSPRPETEIIIEEAIARLGARRDESMRIVDVGTGSGCLAVSLALEFPHASVEAIDVSPAALTVARRNAERLGAAERVSFREASLLEGVEPGADLVVSNPPYIPSEEIERLPVEVREHEPLSALDGGADGLDLVRSLFEQAARVLRPGGWLLCEFGYGQSEGIRAAAAASPLTLVDIRNDLQAIPRTAVLQQP